MYPRLSFRRRWPIVSLPQTTQNFSMIAGGAIVAVSDLLLVSAGARSHVQPVSPGATSPSFPPQSGHSRFVDIEPIVARENSAEHPPSKASAEAPKHKSQITKEAPNA